jgi:hypothetical protein
MVPETPARSLRSLFEEADILQIQMNFHSNHRLALYASSALSDTSGRSGLVVPCALG